MMLYREPLKTSVFKRFSLDVICDAEMKNVLPCTFFIDEFRRRRNIASVKTVRHPWRF